VERLTFNRRESSRWEVAFSACFGFRLRVIGLLHFQIATRSQRKCGLAPPLARPGTGKEPAALGTTLVCILRLLPASPHPLSCIRHSPPEHMALRVDHALVFCSMRSVKCDRCRQPGLCLDPAARFHRVAGLADDRREGRRGAAQT
jgi:hypothetical protein